MRPAVLRKARLVIEPVAGSASIVAVFQDYLELTKPRVTLLVVLTAIVGFVMAGAGGPPDLWLLVNAALGTALTAGGAAAVNQFIEREPDGRMERTRERPMPSGRLHPLNGLAFGVGLAALGLTQLLLHAPPLAAALAAATFGSYVLLYTPLKRRTHLSTLVGAVPGALPPLIGWAAAAGEVSAPSLSLFGILFFWQLPHFLAIAWLYREDYARAGFPMLTVVDPSGRAAAGQILSQTVALIAVSLLPAFLGQAGAAYAGWAVALGAAFLAVSIWLSAARSDLSARAVILGSIVYLPALLIALVLDRIP